MLHSQGKRRLLEFYWWRHYTPYHCKYRRYFYYCLILQHGILPFETSYLARLSALSVHDLLHNNTLIRWSVTYTTLRSTEQQLLPASTSSKSQNASSCETQTARAPCISFADVSTISWADKTSDVSFCIVRVPCSPLSLDSLDCFPNAPLLPKEPWPNHYPTWIVHHYNCSGSILPLDLG